MPKEGENKFSFQNQHKQLLALFVVYADFEAYIEKIKGPELYREKSNMQKTDHYEACQLNKLQG